jgi:hypothetical protein
MFPCKWMSQATPVVLYGVPPPGQPPTHWAIWAPVLSPTVPTTPPTQTKEDIRHPKIKLLMDLYLKKYNNFVNLLDILTLLGKQMTDLPTLLKYCHPSGQLFLCWNSVLGKCFRGSRCKFSWGHLKRGDVTEAFADAISDCISKGVLYCTNLPAGEDYPSNKRKDGVGGPTGS